MPNWAYNKIYARDKVSFEKLKECVLNHDAMDFNRILPMPRELEDIPADHRHLDYIAYAIGDGTPVDRIMVCDHIKQRYPHVVFTSDGKPVDVALDGSTVDAKIDEGEDAPFFFNMGVVDQIAAKSKDIDLARVAAEDKRALSNPKSHINHGLTWKQLGAKCLKALVTCGATNWYDWCCAKWGSKWNASETIVDDDAMSIYFETAWSPVDDLMRLMTKKTGVPVYMEYSEEQFSAFAGEAVFANGECMDVVDAEGDEWDCYRIAAHMQDPDEEYHRYTEKDGILTDYGWGDDEEDKDLFEKAPPQDDLTSPMYLSFMNGEYELAELAEETV